MHKNINNLLNDLKKHFSPIKNKIKNKKILQ